MADFSEIKNGSHVRVEFEGVMEDGGVRCAGNVYLHSNHALRGAVAIEKIEPPVETFGPGDTVRHLTVRDLVYSVAEGGYFAHHAGKWLPSSFVFTSKHYEKVNIG